MSWYGADEIPAEYIDTFITEATKFFEQRSSLAKMKLKHDYYENPQTFKISLGLSVIIRVTLRDGTYHEDIGYGHIENCKGKAAAFEKAKKEGTTDALKRALRNFGNVLGNCIYDKDYVAKVTKMKVGPVKFDEGNLHRHSDFAKKTPDVVKVEPKENGEKGVVAEKMTAHGGFDSDDIDWADADMMNL